MWAGAPPEPAPADAGGSFLVRRQLPTYLEFSFCFCGGAGRASLRRAVGLVAGQGGTG